MSKCRSVRITCPKCNQEHDFTIWESINTALDPEMKQAVRDGSAFLFTCPDCGEKTNVEYGFLYHQMEDRIMIHYATSDENAEEIKSFLAKGFDDFPGMSFKENGYLLRIVRTKAQLLEKLAVIDAGLDDRVVEIVKLFVRVQYTKENKDNPVEESYMYFSDGQKTVQLVLADGTFASANIPDEYYESIRSQFEHKMPALRADDELVIDHEWAMKLLANRG